ncbi:hypothetical protein [Streptomyces sp. NPDC001978]|uniref:hypothetical protein n=1 Tax=Streptomyces sp. NPDC001978 TaxID=3364627 RepID=UPI0036A11619
MTCDFTMHTAQCETGHRHQRGRPGPMPHSADQTRRDRDDGQHDHHPEQRHPDLVKLEVSLPPAKPAAPPCGRCHGRRVLALTQWDKHLGMPGTVVHCPDNSACTATMLHALHDPVLV